MEGFIRYIIISTSCLSLFYIGYLIFLKRKIQFTQQRYYLLASIFIALIMPFSTYSFDLGSSTSNLYTNNEIQHSETNPNINKHTDLSQAPVIEKQQNKLNRTVTLQLLYFFILSLLLIRIFFQFFKIFKLKKSCKKIYHNERIFLTHNKVTSPFTFFNQIFIPADYFNKDKDAILIHERIHATQYHSIDLIIIELLISIMWFNPLIWMMKKSIQSLHEYLADEGVLNTGTDKLRYQALLINQVVEESLICLSSNFNQSLIKKRIVMMTKSKFDQDSKLRILILIPLAIIAFIAVSCSNSQKTLNEVTVVEPVNMNVLYVGIKNPIKIATSGYNVSDLIATVDNGTISGNNGEYIVKPEIVGTANVSVKYKNVEIKNSSFRVKHTPDPVGMIAGLKRGNISKKKLLKADKLYAIMENFDFDVAPEIQEFVVSIVKHGFIIDSKSNSNVITKEQKELIKTANIGQEIYFKSIKCKGPDGALRELSVMDFMITE